MVLIPFCTPLNVREGLLLQGNQEEMQSPKLTTKTEKANKNHFRPFSEQACALLLINAIPCWSAPARAKECSEREDINERIRKIYS
jgi:hypothetical protein